MIDDRISILREIFKSDKKIVEAEFSLPFYLTYLPFFKDTLRFDGYIEGVLNVFKLVEASEKTVLDLGCGFGLFSILLALAGAKQVAGIDINNESIEVFKKIISRFDPPLCNVYPEIGDGAGIGYKDNSFDVAVVSSVISHVKYLEQFLLELKRVLKKDGKLFLCDDNNSLSIYGGIFHKNYYKQVEYGGHNDPRLPQRSFIDIRREIIKERYSQIDDIIINLLAKKTKGLWQDEIVIAVQEYLDTGSISKNKAKFKCVDPRTGLLIEQEFNPFKVKNLLKRLGFECVIIPPFSRPIYPYFAYGSEDCRFMPFIKNTLKKSLSYFYPLSIFISTNFVILAVKKQ